MRPGETDRDRRLRRPLRRRRRASRARTTRPSAARFTVTRGGAPYRRSTRRERFFPVERMPTTEAGIDTNLLARPLRRPRRPGGDGGWPSGSTTTRSSSGSGAAPRSWRWAALVSLTDRRLRVGAPARPRPARGRQPREPDRGARDSLSRRGAGGACSSSRCAAVLRGGGVFLALGLTRDPGALPSALVGKPAPEFSLPPLAGPDEPGSPRRPRRRAMLVNVFASWCVPCRIEHPLLMRLAEQGVTVQGINYKDKPEDAEAGSAELGDPYQRIGRRPGRQGRASTGASTACPNLRHRQGGPSPTAGRADPAARRRADDPAAARGAEVSRRGAAVLLLLAGPALAAT